MALPRLRARVRHQGAGLAAAHVATGRAHRSSRGRFHRARRRDAEDGDLRIRPVRDAAVPRGRAAVRAGDRGTRRHRNRLRLAHVHGATRPQAAHRVLVRRAPRVRDARSGRAHAGSRQRRGPADGEPRCLHGRAVPHRRVLLRAHTHARSAAVRRRCAGRARDGRCFPRRRALLHRIARHQRVHRRVPHPHRHVHLAIGFARQRAWTGPRRRRRDRRDPRRGLHAVDGAARAVRAQAARRRAWHARSDRSRVGDGGSTARGHLDHRRVSAAVPQRDSRSSRRPDPACGAQQAGAAARRDAAGTCSSRVARRTRGGAAMNFNPADLTGVLPALILAAGALVLLISEVFLRAVRPEALGRAGGQPVTPAQRAEARLPKGSQGYSEPAPAADRRYQAWLSAVFAGLAFWAAVSQLGDPATPLFSGGAVSDAFGRVVSAVVCVSLLLSCLVSFRYLEALRATRGEFYALALFSASGMCLLGQATDLIVIFISLEVMSLAVYCLSAYLRRGTRPAEAAFKYFVLGSFASAMFLYGAALAYGATGSTRLGDVANSVRLAASGGGRAGTTRLPFGAGALLAAGFAFKVAA